MIFGTSRNFAKVWKIKKTEKYMDLQITTSEKDQRGNYVNSSWFPRVIGHAFNSLKDIKENDRIIITKYKLTNERKKTEDGEYKSYFRFIILEAEVDTNNGQATAEAAPAKNPAVVEEHEDKEEDCPW